MKQTLSAIGLLLLCNSLLVAQPSYTANDSVPAFSGKFGVGVNFGFYANWSNINQATIAAGNPSIGIEGVGANTIRPGMYAEVFEVYGYNLSVPEFNTYAQLGLTDFTAIVGGPPEWQRDFTNYCTNNPSTLFKNLYLPIWDNSDGTPINENNYYANYLYKLVTQYKDQVTFWEIWNEPGFDYTAINGRKVPGEPGNWWDNDPDPCDYKLRAPIQQYIRMLRISWEVIKSLDPNGYVTIGDPGFPSFLDAVLRNTDNPNEGIISADFPLKGGAYFDCMTFHSYPHFDFTAYDPFINLYKRHSDGAADGLVVAKDRMQAVLNNYGYNGITHPKKLWNVTEYNVPRRAITGPWMQGVDMQVNYLLKVLMKAKVEQIAQMHIYNLFDVRNDAEAIDEFDLMGLYGNQTGVLPYQQVVNPQGKAMRTYTELLDSATFNQQATNAMQLPANVRGYAFQNADNSLIYALWAETKTDLSEQATATYSFPAALGLDSLERLSWDYGYTNTLTKIQSTNIALGPRPVFFRRAENNLCQLTTSASNILCNDNGTALLSSDDKWSFNLTVQAANGSSAGWYTLIGTDTISGAYNQAKLIHNLAISGGNLQISVKDRATSSCAKTLVINAPATCSVPPATSYCESKSEFPWHDWIAGVKVGSLNNPSGKNSFTDFTNQSVTLASGQDHPTTLTAGFSWLTFNEYFRIWIDFNKNNVFDANEVVLEKILNAPPTGGTSVQNSIIANLTIPAGAATGTTRMRVSMKRGSYASACELLPFGEVEDYTVNITGPVVGGCSINATISDITCNDNGTPTIGSDDTYTFKALVTGTNTGTSWTGTTSTNVVSGQYNVARVFGPYSILQGTTVSFADQANNTCVTTAQITKPNPCSTGGGTGTYCNSTSDFPWHDWIAQIKVADLSHVTGKSQYTNYPDKIATLQRGVAQTVQLTAGYSWLVEDEYWTIWIDYNKDGNFTSDEVAFSKFNPKSPFPVSLWSVNGSLTVPSTVQTGVTRMRIVMQRGNTPPAACGNYANGETEDYSVNIVSGTTPSCTLFPQVSSLACQSKNTPDPLDDTYSFDLLVTGAGQVSASGWVATIGTTQVTGSYGTPKSIANRLISAGSITIEVKDAIDPTCTQTIAVTPPATCSSQAGPCTVSSAFPWHDWIAGVKISNLNQTSGKSQYSDFTSQAANLVIDSAYQLSLTAGFSWFTYTEFWRIWVDKNKNGVWESTEIVYQKSFAPSANGVSSLTYTDSLTLSNFTPGNYKMRIMMRRDAWPEPCGTLDYGEIEDYSLLVSQSLVNPTDRLEYQGLEKAFSDQWLIYPNPASDYLEIQLEQAEENAASYILADQLGRVLRSGQFAPDQTMQTLRISDLASGVYQLQMTMEGKRPTVKRLVVINPQ